MPVYNFYNYLIDKQYIASYREYRDNNDLLDDFRKKKISYVFANNHFDTTENAKSFEGLPGRELMFSAKGFYLFKIKQPNTRLQ
jgi:hypothetical protein